MNLINGVIGKEVLFDDKQDLIQQLYDLRQGFENMVRGCRDRTCHFPVIVDKSQMAELVTYECAACDIMQGIDKALKKLNKQYVLPGVQVYKSVICKEVGK